MTGPNFLGISGVVCGMIGFIAARQQTAPWEGYHFSQLMYSILLFIIWTLVAMSIGSFFLESYLRIEFPISFANTAHLMGLSLGLVFGQTRWFSMTRTI
jgi:GlpG protein